MRRTLPQRRGYALVELLVVMVAGTALLGLAIGLIHTLLSVSRAGRILQADRAAMARLAEVFRADVRAARRVEPGDGQDGRLPDQASTRLVLSGPDRRAVEYRDEREGLARVQRDGDEVRRQELFRLPSGRRARLGVGLLEGQTIVSLVFDRVKDAVARAGSRAASAPAASDPSPAALRVETVLGRDHRFETAREP